MICRTSHRRRMACGAFLGCLVLSFTFCNILKPYFSHLYVVNFEQSISFGHKLLGSSREIICQQPEPQQSPSKPSLLNWNNTRSQVYELYGDIRIHGSSSTIWIASPHDNFTNTAPHLITKPYARLYDSTALSYVSELNIIRSPPPSSPDCTRFHGVPAVVFSSGGYGGNPFHDFADIVLPLYLTSHQFNRTVVFLVTDTKPWWIKKYELILERLSEHSSVDLGNSSEVLCFSTVVVGLKAHDDLRLNPNEPPYYSITGFTRFLRDAYSLPREVVVRNKGRPRVLIISRRKTRHLTNQKGVARMCQRLGFDVSVREMGWELPPVARYVNSFDVLVGMHGAGLTNMVFMPENGLVIQIVPYGLDSVADEYFGIPAREMNLKYLDYRVGWNESSLAGKYSSESDVFMDPPGIRRRAWTRFRSVYLDNQDVKVDVKRFEKTLVKALELVRDQRFRCEESCSK